MPEPTPQNNEGRRRAALALAALAAFLIVLAGAMILGGRDTVGDVDRFNAPPPPDNATTTIVGSPGGDPPEDGSVAIPANELSLLTDIADHGGSQPVRLRIDSIGVSAPIVPAGVEQDTGLMEVPENVDEVAWYRYGPRPGQPGSAVLAAHVDLAGEGPGVFFDLADIEPGDRILVEFDDGTARSFTVKARTIYLKDELPLDTVFRRDGEPILTLITCGGAFDDSARSYDSNVVAYAVPSEFVGQ
jgi:Sortase domain